MRAAVGGGVARLGIVIGGGGLSREGSHWRYFLYDYDAAAVASLRLIRCMLKL